MPRPTTAKRTSGANAASVSLTQQDILDWLEIKQAKDGLKLYLNTVERPTVILPGTSEPLPLKHGRNRAWIRRTLTREFNLKKKPDVGSVIEWEETIAYENGVDEQLNQSITEDRMEEDPFIQGLYYTLEGIEERVKLAADWYTEIWDRAVKENTRKGGIYDMKSMPQTVTEMAKRLLNMPTTLKTVLGVEFELVEPRTNKGRLWKFKRVAAAQDLEPKEGMFADERLYPQENKDTPEGGEGGGSDVVTQ